MNYLLIIYFFPINISIVKYMPTFNFYKKKGNNYRRKKNYKAKKRQQLLSVDTVEKVAKQVVQNSQNQTRLTLIKRNFISGRPDPDTNHMPEDEFLRPHFGGTVVYISNIRKQDQATQIVVPAPNDPLTAENETDIGVVGTNLIAPRTTLHSQRTVNDVKLTGVSVQIRAKCHDLFPRSTANTPVDMLYPIIKVKYAIVLARWNGMEGLQQLPDGSQGWYKPNADQLLRLNPLGYSKILDQTKEAYFSSLKVKRLVDGEFTLKPNTTYIDQKEVSKYIRFPKPILLSYDPTDQIGFGATKWKCYFVIKSNIPPPNVAEQYERQIPDVLACTKLFYFE